MLLFFLYHFKCRLWSLNCGFGLFSSFQKCFTALSFIFSCVNSRSLYIILFLMYHGAPTGHLRLKYLYSFLCVFISFSLLFRDSLFSSRISENSLLLAYFTIFVCIPGNRLLPACHRKQREQRDQALNCTLHTLSD